MPRCFWLPRFAGLLLLLLALPVQAAEEDALRTLQTKAIEDGKSPAAHWGPNPENYKEWSTHSNRLIPVYTYGTKGAGEGVDLDSYMGERSPYRSAEALRRIYGRMPVETLDPEADYLDQTNIYDLQMAGIAAGKKYVFLVIFDGMDWQTTQAAAIYNSGRVPYTEGRGTGTHFQEYQAGGTTQFGSMVTAPHNEGTTNDVDQQTVKNPGGTMFGGYNRERGGPNPWTPGNDILYLITRPPEAPFRHPYTDSSCSASNMTAGIKSYNGAVNVDPTGAQLTTIAHRLQEQGYAVGAVTSVPISHATPAAAYAHNVDRDDYQDLTRDLLGLRSIAHPETPLSGLDVLIGGGYGTIVEKAATQGMNYVPGNLFLTDADLKAVDVEHGGKYAVAVRTPGVSGPARLQQMAVQAAEKRQRLLGFYGIGATKGHLPYATANGDFQPAPGRSNAAEKYTAGDLEENPTLAQMTTAAITVLSQNPKGFWLMVEPGDVDWANHDNNLDTSIGAVNSGDAAVKTITDWVEAHSNWQESLVIVTADHGHYLHLTQPELLVPAPR